MQESETISSCTEGKGRLSQKMSKVHLIPAQLSILRAGLADQSYINRVAHGSNVELIQVVKTRLQLVPMEEAKESELKRNQKHQADCDYQET